VYESVKSEGDASTANNNSPTPSSSSSTGETSFWTRSHFKPKPGNSALRKNGTDIEDTVASPPERTTLGSLFGRSQLSLPLRTRTEPRPRPKSSEDVRPLLLSKAPTPDAPHSRPGRQALKTSLQPLLHPSHSVRVRGPGRDVSPSPTSRLASQGYLEERRDLRASRSISLHSESSSVLQAWSTDPLSASPPVPPMPTMTPAHTASRQMNQLTQQNEASLLRRLEGMTDEERLELAIQESKKDAALASHDPLRQNTTRSPFTSFSRVENLAIQHNLRLQGMLRSKRKFRERRLNTKSRCYCQTCHGHHCLRHPQCKKCQGGKALWAGRRKTRTYTQLMILRLLLLPLLLLFREMK
jgi:hypothetical protein